MTKQNILALAYEARKALKENPVHWDICDEGFAEKDGYSVSITTASPDSSSALFVELDKEQDGKKLTTCKFLKAECLDSEAFDETIRQLIDQLVSQLADRSKSGVTISFKVGNAAFHREDGSLDEIAIGAQVVKIGTAIANGARRGSIIDVNGNKVGEFAVEG